MAFLAAFATPPDFPLEAGKKVRDILAREEGWLVEDVDGVLPVTRGSLVMGELLGEKSFSPEESDQWIECFDQAEKHGHWFEFHLCPADSDADDEE